MSNIAVALFLGILFIIIALLFLYRFYFLRKPERKIPRGNVVVSPASGRIIRIMRIKDKDKRIDVKKGFLGSISVLVDDFKDGCYVIVIMMTPLDVHYQRAPVEGVVKKVSYTSGLKLNAVRKAAELRTLENEKNEILISNEKLGCVKVIQIAGFLARRIRCFVRTNQKIDKGEEIGLICLGSQVMLVIPEIKLKIKNGQRVVDGETVIAEF